MPRILLISSSPPHPPTRGGNQRTNLLYRALQRAGEAEFLLVHPPTSPPSEDDALVLQRDYAAQRCSGYTPRGQRGAWRVARPLAPRVIDRLAHNLGSSGVAYAPDPGIAPWLADRQTQRPYDLIVSRYLQPAALAGALAYSPLIVDVDDLDTQRYVSRLGVPGQAWWKRMVLQRHIAALNRIVPQCLRQADHLFVTNQEDLGHIEHPSISILPNIPYTPDGGVPEPLPEQSSSKVILTVSSMRFRVNEEAVENFVMRVWPRILAAEPEARFRIVGSGMSDAQRARWSAQPGVEALGFVDDIVAQYRASALTVTPIYEGGGTKIKVLESLLYGRVPVITQHALRGYEHVLSDGEALAVAPDEAAFGERCVALLRAPAERQRLAQCGAALVAEHFSFDGFAAVVAGAVAKVAPGLVPRAEVTS